MKKLSAFVTLAALMFSFLTIAKAYPLFNNGSNQQFNIFDLYVANNNVYLSTNHGLFNSTDQGKTWQKFYNLDLTAINQTLEIQNKIIVRGEMQGKQFIYLSQDNGASWKNITPPNGSNFYTMTEHNNSLYVSGVGNNSTASQSQNTIYETKDFVNWSNNIASAIFPKITSVSVTDDALYFGSHSDPDNVGLYKIIPPAQLQHFNVSQTEENSIDDIYINTNHVYVVCNNKLYIAALNDLSNFQAVPNINSARKIFGMGDIIYVGCDDGVYESYDAGMNWKHLTDIPNIRQIAATKNIIYIIDANDYLYSSTDSGQSWHNIDYTLKVTSIVQDSQGRIYAATNDGIRLSTDQGRTWQAALMSQDIKNVVIDQQNNNAYTITNDSLYRSTDNGKTWLHIFSPPQQGDLIENVIANNGNILIGTERTVYAIFNGSTQVTAVLATYEPKFFFTLGDKIYLATFNSILQSTDYGKIWQTLYQAPYSQYYDTIFADQQNIYAGSSYGIITSADQGKSWHTITGTENWNVTDITGMAQILFAVHDSQLVISNNQGKTWTIITTPFAVTYILPTKNNILYAGSTDSGLYASYDNGASWQRRF